MKKIIAIVLAAITYCQYANAIVIRHDVDDKEYLKLGEQYSPSVGYVAGCAATLINENWLLTVAHCVEGNEDNIFYAKHMGQKYRVETIIIHPKFNRNNDEQYDAAMVQLKDPIMNGLPAKLYQQSNEVGQPVIFVGRGTYGNGRDGLITDDFQQRGATNTVMDANEYVIGFEFTAPEKAATPLEGISSRGDSGGPAFVELNSERYVIGISSYQVGNGKKEGHYGVLEYYTRVSTIYPWLKSVVKNTAVANIPKHAIIDAILDDNNDSFEKAINAYKVNGKADIEKALVDKEILSEAFYQTVKLNRIDYATQLIENGVDYFSIIIDKVSLFDFVLQNRRKDYFVILQQAVNKQEKMFPKNSAVLPLYIANFLKDDVLLNGVKQLLQHGANINAKTNAGDTALIITGWSTNNITLIKYLVEAGADLNIANNNGDTPLMDAAYLGKLGTLKYLLDKGANTELKNKRGFTALDLAKSKQHHDAVKILMAHKK
ncbi:ankyrin repeat protein [Pleionea mediterranea]|uniref:Ankyrin repeat protein n=1 Tax=Pleionea mediterranea TaxID=523701 RepID=A0A316FWE9_9GAMM|nr:ankyrin repeat protein [Pleionea mediterranea]